MSIDMLKSIEICLIMLSTFLINSYIIVNNLKKGDNFEKGYTISDDMEYLFWSKLTTFI